MADLPQRLEQLGLLQYLDIFVAEGFDTWETVLDIRESDLDALNVKLGHRRKLQRAIAEARSIPLEGLNRAGPHLNAASSVDGSYRSDDSALKTRSLSHYKRIEPPSGNTSSTTKRKCRRRPKPDENAPERPASAYVIFSNQMRESLKGQELSFTEVAKLVGERWQTLSPGAREARERQAAAAKEKYYAELAEYKKTSEYIQYQEYLAEFRAKHNQQQSGKRTTAEPETNVNFDESHRRTSDAYFCQPSHLVQNRSDSSPPPGSHRASGRMLGSESTCPAA
ncbi:High mobility group B protein 13 [Lasiodiplodia theobromae]|uniref:High mobility group B protein 13 n=1 Tax=Lasiodiplodia theobromae TaxID=45133 RepID=A0A5N5CTE6_9PEZI|nr:High mobility group B protein 13 [Lasiodiplodia theobromae]